MPHFCEAIWASLTYCWLPPENCWPVFCVKCPSSMFTYKMKQGAGLASLCFNLLAAKCDRNGWIDSRQMTVTAHVQLTASMLSIALLNTFTIMKSKREAAAHHS